jgi:hypothetical protein
VNDVVTKALGDDVANLGAGYSDVSYDSVIANVMSELDYEPEPIPELRIPEPAVTALTPEPEVPETAAEIPTPGVPDDYSSRFDASNDSRLEIPSGSEHSGAGNEQYDGC